MTDTSSILRGLRDIVDTAYNDQMTAVSVADQAQMNQAIQRTIRRQERLADYEYGKCNPDYEPMAHDEMGDVNIISGNVITDKDALATVVQQQKQKTKKPADETTQPQVQPQPQPNPQPQKPTIGQQIAKCATLALLPIAASAITYALLNTPQDDYVNTPGIVVTQPEYEDE